MNYIFDTNARAILAMLTAAPLLAAIPAGAGTVDAPTPPALPSMVQSRLNVQIGNDTEEVTFVNTNNDPFVYTKVYKLKHADPYEIRPYIMAAVRSRRVDANETKVEAIKFTDGTGMLIVSAEEYRFRHPDKNAMSIDDIVTSLDKPGLASEAGRKFFIYYPKYFDSVTLATLIRKVGMQHAEDDVELAGGIDTVVPDSKLNALMFYSSPASEKHIRHMLSEYDGPVTEAIVECTVYEIERENDGNIGADFQAWKNGPGADLFATGARYLDGWDLAARNVGGNLVNLKDAHSSFVNFNPKWNSRYLDFLVSKSKARVVTRGTLSIGNGVTATIDSITRMPVIVDGEEIAGSTSIMEAAVTANVGASDSLTGLGYTQCGLKEVSFRVTPGKTAEFSATRTLLNNRSYYTLKCKNGGFYTADGNRLGEIAKVFDAAPALNDTELEWSELNNTLNRSSTRITNSDTDYGFSLAMTPYVYGEATNLSIDMTSTNLIGFKSDGRPRTSKTELKTEIQVGNSAGIFYIGGLEKSAIVRSVNKVPLLGDLPLIGFVFSAESETVKKTEIVTVLTVVPVNPDTKLPAATVAEAAKINDRIDKAGVKAKWIDENDYGFDQFLIDPDKKHIDE